MVQFELSSFKIYIENIADQPNIQYLFVLTKSLNYKSVN